MVSERGNADDEQTQAKQGESEKRTAHPIVCYGCVPGGLALAPALLALRQSNCSRAGSLSVDISPCLFSRIRFRIMYNPVNPVEKSG